MEKEIIIALLVLILWQCILGMFMRNIMKKYIKIVKQYNYSEGENLSPEWKEKTAHLLKRAKILCAITFGSSSSKKLYNTLCYMLATTEFMDGNTDEFFGSRIQPRGLFLIHMQCCHLLWRYTIMRKEIGRWQKNITEVICCVIMRRKTCKL